MLGSEGGKVRAQDAPRLLSSLVYAQGSAGRRLAWAFCAEHWQHITERFTGSMFIFARIVSALVSPITWPSDISAAREFFRVHPVEGADQALEQSLETAQQNVNFIRANEEAICSYLSAHPEP